MVQEQKPALNTRREIRGRPHERTIEQLVFVSWIGDFSRENSLSPATSTWLEHRFLDELDRRRGLEHRWRKVFWSTRYAILAGSLTLPVLITAGKSIAWLNLAAIVVSIIVALATAVEALLRSGRKWRLYRQGADQLSSEGTAFFQTLDMYSQLDPVDRLHMFMERVEANIKDLHESYVADIEIMASQNVISSSSDKPS